MSVEVIPVDGLPEVRPGDDLASMLEEPPIWEEFRAILLLVHFKQFGRDHSSRHFEQCGDSHRRS